MSREHTSREGAEFPGAPRPSRSLSTAGAHSSVLPTRPRDLTFMVWLLRQHEDRWRPLSGAAFLLRSSRYKLRKMKSCD